MKCAALTAFLPNLQWFPSPRGLNGSTVQDQSARRELTRRAHGPDARNGADVVPARALRRPRAGGGDCPVSVASAAATTTATAAATTAATAAGPTATARRPAAVTALPPAAPAPSGAPATTLPPDRREPHDHQHHQHHQADFHDPHGPHRPPGPPKRGARFLRDWGMPLASGSQSRLEQLQRFGPG